MKERPTRRWSAGGMAQWKNEENDYRERPGLSVNRPCGVAGGDDSATGPPAESTGTMVTLGGFSRASLPSPPFEPMRSQGYSAHVYWVTNARASASERGKWVGLADHPHHVSPVCEICARTTEMRIHQGHLLGFVECVLGKKGKPQCDSWEVKRFIGYGRLTIGTSEQSANVENDPTTLGLHPGLQRYAARNSQPRSRVARWRHTPDCPLPFIAEGPKPDDALLATT